MTPPTGGGRLSVPYAYAEHRYAVLFYALLLTLGAAPLFAALHVSAQLKTSDESRGPNGADRGPHCGQGGHRTGEET